MKKIIASVLVVASMLALLTGCGAGGHSLLNINYAYDVSDLDSTAINHAYALTAEDMNPTEREMKKAGEWLTKYVLESNKTGKAAFDFTVGGEAFSSVLSSWTMNCEQTADDEDKTDYTVTYEKAGQPLKVSVYATVYKNYPIVEYTPWIENVGEENSAEITDFYGISGAFAEGEDTSEMLMTRYHGSTYSATAFMPETKVLGEGANREFAAVGGKPTEYWMTYFNTQWNSDSAEWGREGIFFSIGWPGQWKATVENSGKGFTVAAGQEKLAAYLKPGEKIRSALMTLMFWEKDLMRAQNFWRRFVNYLASPQPNGEPIKAAIGANTGVYTNLTESATTQNQIEAIDLWREKGLKFDYWQMDAGWYPIAKGYDRWVGTGNWYPDPARFENGSLKAISDHLHEQDQKLILWFEPERVTHTSDWGVEYGNTDWIIKQASPNYCFNFSNDEAVDFLIKYILTFMEANGVDVYRQDCNFADADAIKTFWAANDEEGRTGITENKYLVNYLRYYDAILEAHPDSFIDSCATGGRRLDLETVRRSVPLWRDDLCYQNTVSQCQSYGINFLLPYSGQGMTETSKTFMKYAARSNMMTFGILPMDLRFESEDSELVARVRRTMDEWREFQPYMTKDYYPLSVFSAEENAWLAWQFNDPETGKGFVEVFKRVQSEETKNTYYLCGLDPDTTYHFEDVDTGETLDATGAQVMCNGITVGIYDEMDAKIYRYAPVTAE